jgi:hypothetical protein
MPLAAEPWHWPRRSVAALFAIAAALLTVLVPVLSQWLPEPTESPSQLLQWELRHAHELLSDSLASTLTNIARHGGGGALQSCGERYPFAVEARLHRVGSASGGGSGWRGESEAVLLLLQAVTSLEAQVVPGSMQHLAALVLSACAAQQHAGSLESQQRLATLQLSAVAARQAASVAATSELRDKNVQQAVQQLVTESEALWRAELGVQQQAKHLSMRPPAGHSQMSDALSSAAPLIINRGHLMDESASHRVQHHTKVASPPPPRSHNQYKKGGYSGG